MNKHVVKGWARHLRQNKGVVRFAVVARVAVLAGVITVAGLGFTQYADAAQTASDFCSKYSGDAQTACKDGIRGADCNDYSTIFSGQANVNDIVSACNNGASAKQSGQITDTSTSTGSSSSDACSNYNGDLLQACQGGKTNGQCNPSTASSDPQLYAACQAGAGQNSNNSSTLSSTQQQSYNTAIVLSCSQYSGNASAQAACLAAGLGKNGTGTPLTNSDCLTNSAYNNSTALQNACITGSTAGQSYLSTLNSATSSTNPNSILDQLDQANSLSQYIDVLHSTGSDANTDTSKAADNNYGSYVNGAGKQQPITVMPCSNSGDKCPALIWLNGGGWHADDGTAYCIATGSSQKNCQASADGSGDTGAGAEPAPTGGGANSRGYTVIEVSYRLGSSGVYYMFEDVMRGIQHVINNADLYHIDPSKIAVGGDSAGGSLAMRAVASGKSGAKVGVGWSSPTNAYTALFKSYKSLLIGMDHSTCIPTDLAGLTNTTDLLSGGSGDVAQYGQGISSNDFSGLGLTSGQNGIISGASGDGLSSASDALSTLTQVLSAAQYAADTSQNVESISQQLESAYNSSSSGGGSSSLVSGITSSGLSSGVFNLSAKKLSECIDNFNVLSPALFASTETPPSFLAGFDNDDLIDPQQLYDMRDKLQELGIRSEALVIPGDPDAPANALGATNNHLGYDPRFVCKTLDFIDSVVQPDKQHSDDHCATGVDTAAAAPSTDTASSGSSSSSSSSSQSSSSSDPAAACRAKGSPWYYENGECKNAVSESNTASNLCLGKGGTYHEDVHGGYCDIPSTTTSSSSNCIANSVSSVGCLDSNGNCTANSVAGTGCLKNSNDCLAGKLGLGCLSS